MTTLARTQQHPLVQTVAKACDGDEGTARVLVRLALYDALCRDVDELRPEIEEAVSKVVRREAARGLQVLAKRDITPETARAAEALWALTQIGKAADDPRTPYWDARGEGGKFVSGRGSRALGRGLDMMGSPREDSLEGKARPMLDGLAGEKATTYSRARVLGNALTAVDTPETRALGTLARVVGEIGPEAQAALEPGIRRAAYRYRGTERRPNAEMQRSASVIARLAEGDIPPEGSAGRQLVQRWAQEVSAETQRDTMQTAGMRGAGPREVISPGAMSYALLRDQAKNSTLTPDQRRLDAVGQFAVLQLRKQVPNPEVAEISRASGKMPPSVGLLMDAEGRIVSEAMGFNGDHYLPFDLKNLKALRGGQYVRTRTSGGPTDEDIYTGLLTGARQIEVVSNSGVFKVEFDPDLRGGRRYSDKARQMVDRYAKIVATIESGSLTKNPLPAEQVKAMREKAIEDATDATGKTNYDLANDYFNEAQTDAMRAAEFGGIDEDSLRAEAKALADAEYKQGLAVGGNKPRVSNRTRLQTEKDIFNELKTQAYEGRYQKYRADGEGYKAALTALQQEFPYFIRRVDHTPLGDYLIDRKQLGPDEPLPGGGGGRDRGYTRRGQLAPAVRDEEGKARNRTIGAQPKTAAALRGGAGAPGAEVAEEEVEQTASQAPQAPAGAVGFGSAAKPASTSTATEQAIPYTEVAQSPKVQAQLRNALGRTIPLRLGYGENQGLSGPLGSDTLEDVLSDGSAGPLLSYLAGDKMGVPRMVEWLQGKGDLEPKASAAHIDTIKRALVSLQTETMNPQDRAAYAEDFERSVALLDALKAAKGGFDTVTELPVDPLAGAGEPKPQGYNDIVGSGASRKNLTAFAADRRNAEVVALADEWLTKDDQEIAEDISTLVQRIDEANNNQDKTNSELVALAADWARPGGKTRAELDRMQRAWTFKRANQVAALAAGEAPRPFSGVVKSLRPPLPPRRVVVHDPSSPVAKAFAARLRR